jgi:hypothetical protein
MKTLVELKQAVLNIWLKAMNNTAFKDYFDGKVLG